MDYKTILIHINDPARLLHVLESPLRSVYGSGRI